MNSLHYPLNCRMRSLTDERTPPPWALCSRLLVLCGAGSLRFENVRVVLTLCADGVPSDGEAAAATAPGEEVPGFLLDTNL
mmetsp:Transcript_27021/g.50965  ORF Transcript_27021/g.50965 Transcript_27021/m.50965 type:complete len:81 (-) Transcript_27021:1755-1997(-)